MRKVYYISIVDHIRINDILYFAYIFWLRLFLSFIENPLQKQKIFTKKNTAHEAIGRLSEKIWVCARERNIFT